MVSTHNCSAPAIDPPPDPPLVVPVPLFVRPVPLEPEVMSATLSPHPTSASAATRNHLSLTSIVLFMHASTTTKSTLHALLGPGAGPPDAPQKEAGP
jgi:hypothetical protein